MLPTAANERTIKGRKFGTTGRRALPAAFPSGDTWPNLSKAERDEWRGYFDGMLEGMHLLKPERAPWLTMLGGAGCFDDRAP